MRNYGNVFKIYTASNCLCVHILVCRKTRETDFQENKTIMFNIGSRNIAIGSMKFINMQ